MKKVLLMVLFCQVAWSIDSTPTFPLHDLPPITAASPSQVAHLVFYNSVTWTLFMLHSEHKTLEIIEGEEKREATPV